MAGKVSGPDFLGHISYMTPIQKPESLPNDLLPTFERMQNAANPEDKGAPSCEEVLVVTDWFFQTRWHGDLMTADELEWLLGWMRRCGDPKRFEIGDAVCLGRLEQGQLDASIELARSLRAEQKDFGLGHSLALGLAAKGEKAQAIAALEQIIAEAVQHPQPADVMIQAYLDLAQLHQQQGALFKALAPARQALELAAQHDLEDALAEAANFLVQQLVAQGGADEAWSLLQPLLKPERAHLWQIVFDQLESQLSADELERGAEALTTHGNPELVVKVLAERANRSQDRQDLTLAYAAALILKAPIDIVAPLASVLLLRDEDRQGDLAPLIAASAIAVAEIEENRNVKQAQWHRSSVVLLISVARHQGVPEAAVRQWAEDEKLYAEQGVIKRTSKALIESLHHPPAWLIRTNDEAEST